MPILRRNHQRCEGILFHLLQIRFRLEQCAGAQIMTATGGKHERSEALRPNFVDICLCLEQCAGDLLEMV